MKNIVVQILRSPAGGIRKHVLDIIDNLASENCRQIFITNMDEADVDLIYLSKNPNIEVFNLPIQEKPGFSDISSLIAIYRILKNKKPTILHGHGAKGGLYARLLAASLGAKSIYTPHGGSLHSAYGSLKNRIYKWIEKILMPLTDIFLFESKYSANAFIKNIGSPGKKECINYNGVDIPEKYSTNLYQAGNPIRFASFGLLRHLKGHDIFIETCKLMKEKNIPFSYIIYGHGDFDSHLNDLIKRYELDSSIQILNYSGDVCAEMLKYDFVVHPSRFESFGYVPAEAMSVKIPVITSQEGGLKEVVNSDSGYISIENTPESYLLIIEKIYRGDPNLPVKIDNAFERVQKLFSKSIMLSRISSIYSQ